MGGKASGMRETGDGGRTADGEGREAGRESKGEGGRRVRVGRRARGRGDKGLKWRKQGKPKVIRMGEK